MTDENIFQVNPTGFKAANGVRNQWSVPEAPFGVSADSFLKSGCWAHVSKMLTRGDIITVMCEDNSYFLELVVFEAGHLFAKVAELRRVTFTAAQILNVDVPEGYEIKFRGPKKWSVLRGTDVLRDGMDKKAAEAWLNDHLKFQVKAA